MRYICQNKEWPAFKCSAKALETVPTEAAYRQGVFFGRFSTHCDVRLAPEVE